MQLIETHTPVRMPVAGIALVTLTETLDLTVATTPRGRRSPQTTAPRLLV